MTYKWNSKNSQKALRERRKAEGLKTLTRYVRPEWIPAIDALISELSQPEQRNEDKKPS